MSEKCKYLNYVELLLIFSVSAFASLVCVSVGIMSSAIGKKICVITAGSKNYKSII